MAERVRGDYYEVLGVSRDAGPQVIERAFQELALRFRQDRGVRRGAAERFRQAVEAYAVLSDPLRRAAYDARGRAGPPVAPAAGPRDTQADRGRAAHFGIPSLPCRGPAGRWELPGPGPAAGPDAPRGADLETTLTIPLERVLTGGFEPVTIRRYGPCTTCAGSGSAPGGEPQLCPVCEGSGRRSAPHRQRGVTLQRITLCPDCGGSGEVVRERCPHCGGVGEVEYRDVVTVRIPPGIDEGAGLRIPGYGVPSPEPGGAPGDAYVVVRTAGDPRFVRRGPDLWCHEEVEVPDAVLGTVRSVRSLDGEAPLTVPPGTQPGDVLRVAGRGLPCPDGAGRGDLRVSVSVHIPDRLGEQERRLYTRLRGSR